MNPPELIDNMAVFTLATGEKLRVSIVEGGLGVTGYRLNVNSDKALLALPSASNSIHLMTPVSLEAEREEIRRTARERERSRG